MLTIGAFEAKNTLGALLDEVERGGEVLITRHGKPIARLVPNNAGIDRQSTQDALNRMRKRAAKLPPGTFEWPKLKKDRDKGRPGATAEDVRVLR